MRVKHAILHSGRAATLGVALLVSANVDAARVAQEALSRPGVGAVVGTLSDPFGKPAEGTLIAITQGRSLTRQTRTDSVGRFRFTDIPPGRYDLSTAPGAFLTPAAVDVARGVEVALELRLSVEPTVVNLQVCRDCAAAVFRRPELSVADAMRPRDRQSAAVLAPAEPEEGWNAFYERPIAYAPALLKEPGLEGEVILEGAITPEGATANLRVVSSPSIRLSEAALNIVQPLQWRPARVRTTPVASTLRATIEFSLRGFQ